MNNSLSYRTAPPARRWQCLTQWLLHALWIGLAIFGLLGAGMATAAPQAGLSILHSFTPYANGANPRAALIRGADGALYGTTVDGGSYSRGTVFRLAADGSSFSLLHNFNGNDGSNPQASLLQGADGALYGTTNRGGSNDVGTVFRLAADGSLSLLHSFDFSDGAFPTAGLIKGTDGALYGTTTDGGSNLRGSVFRLAADGSIFSLLHSFTGSDGANPFAGLLQGADGALYGTTVYGGSNGYGSVFRLAADGSGYSLLHSFTGSDGYAPYAGLLQGADGALYGTTVYGGSNNSGTVFRLAADGSNFSLLHSFTGSDGYYPYAGLLQGVDGALYGTTVDDGGRGIGTIYRLTSDGSSFTQVHNFSIDSNNGAFPYASLLQGADGALYGTTTQGNYPAIGGIVFRLAPDGSYSLLHSFTGSDGAYPYAGLLQGADGALYGTTNRGGTSDHGTVFSLTADGSYSLLYNFNGFDGYAPYAGLLQGADGAFYGTLSYSYGGTVFHLTADGSSFSLLHQFDFSDGSRPYAALIKGADGALYGTTYQGGTYDRGTVFRLATDGSFSLLHSFTGSGSDGAYPYAGLLQGMDGALYGTTFYGGSNGVGTVFRLATDGSLSLLHSFTGSDGAYPYAGLLQGANGALYGTTVAGGSNNSGTVFRLAADGSYSLLHSFNGSNGGTPYAGLLQGADGALYSTTFYGGSNGAGSVFRLAADGSNFSLLHSFNYSDGYYPYAGLLQGGDGALYGTTTRGGTAGAGTVFRLPLPDNTPPVVACGTADSAWHADNVNIACTSSDSGSGLADPADASFLLSTSVPGGTETATASSNSHPVCDVAGNCVTAGPIANNKIDKLAPAITIATPANGATYLLKQVVIAGYSCADGGAGLASCTGSVASGSAIDTNTVGSKTFSVTTSDLVGNTASQTVSYSVVRKSTGSTSSADLGITMNAPAQAARGTDISYAITIQNKGPNNADSVMVSDSIPAGTTFVSATSSQGTLTLPAVGANTGKVLANLGAMTSGGSATLTLVVNIAATAGKSVSNTATVSTTQLDPVNANNSVSTTTRIK